MCVCVYVCMYVCVCLQSLEPELEAQLGEVNKTAPKYSIWTKVKVCLQVPDIRMAFHKLVYCAASSKT